MALKDPKPQDEEVEIPGSHWNNPEYKRIWVEEAERRYQEILDGKVKTISAEEAVRRARAAIR
jgi:hypothetical protein